MRIKVSEIKEGSSLQKAFSIRNEVFVVGQGVPANEEYDEYDAEAHHYMLECDGEFVGTARWRFTNYGIKLERFAILDAYRNKGLGSELLKKIMLDLPKGKIVYLHAQLLAMPLYARQGFEKVGDMFLECDIKHYKMELSSN